MLATGDQIHVYSDLQRIILQLHHSVPTTDDVCAPSFKVAVTLTPDNALALAAELLTATVYSRSPKA